MDVSQRREQNNLQSRSHGSFELVLAPLLLGLLGYWLDGAVGLRPLFTVVFSVLGLVGAVAKIYYSYIGASRR